MAFELLHPVRERVKPRARLVARRLLPVAFAGDRVSCPCCGGRFRSFVPYAGRSGARCPRCLSVERHRLLWLYLKTNHVLFEGSSILHFAPELSLQDNLRAIEGTRYVSADLSPFSLAERRVDITDIPFGDATVDFGLCNHVLEHVTDDRRAMTELVRVLKPTGVAIMQHPVDRGRERTFEDVTVTSPRERDRVYGQRDHVRIYGRDFTDRLTAAGFEVEVKDFFRDLDRSEIARYGLADEPIYLCRRPMSS